MHVQRCTMHKGRNLVDACPVHARAEMRRDYHRIICAHDGLAARAAYDAFLKNGRRSVQPWRDRSRRPVSICSPSTIFLEHVDVVAHNDHTRKSQSRIPATDQDASVLQHRGRGGHVAFGLVAFGQIVLRRIDGHAELIAALAKEWSHVARGHRD